MAGLVPVGNTYAPSKARRVSVTCSARRVSVTCKARRVARSTHQLVVLCSCQVKFCFPISSISFLSLFSLQLALPISSICFYDPRNDVLTSAKRAEALKHAKYDAICEGTGSTFSPFALETTGGHGASTASVYLLLKKQLRAGGRAAWQAREGHLVRATPGHDRPSDYSCPRWIRLASARSSAEAPCPQQTGWRVGIALGLAVAACLAASCGLISFSLAIRISSMAFIAVHGGLLAEQRRPFIAVHGGGPQKSC
jgi:hypothetical protein